MKLKKESAMARVRRKATAKARLNFEIAGIAAIGLAALFAVALSPARAGLLTALGGGMTWLFGAAAPLFPLVVALLGAIIFLEINVPRMMATLGAASLAYFIIADVAFGRRGGAMGVAVWRALSFMLGVLGARIVLALAALLLTVWITNVSVKKVIGLIVLALGKIRVPKFEFALPQMPAPLERTAQADGAPANGRSRSYRR